MDRGYRGLPWRVVAAATSIAGCGTPPAAPPPQQLLPLGVEYNTSDRSSVFSSSTGSRDPGWSKGLAVPEHLRITDSARLTLRPDVLRMSFAVREVGATPESALQAARTKADSVAAELAKATRPSATSKILGFKLTRNTRDGKLVDVGASVDGALEVPLAENEDTWARARLISSLVAAAERLTEPYRGGDDVRAVSFAMPELQLLDPEPHRAELVERWVERARRFAAAAQVDGAPLVIRDCAPPGAIVQTSPAFDQVSLELAFSCRIDIPGPSK